VSRGLGKLGEGVEGTFVPPDRTHHAIGENVSVGVRGGEGEKEADGKQRQRREEKRTHCLTPAFASLLAFILALTVANVKGSAVQNLQGKAWMRQRRRKGRGRSDEPTPSPNTARHEGRLTGELPVLSDFGGVDARVGVVVAGRGGRSSVFVDGEWEKVCRRAGRKGTHSQNTVPTSSGIELASSAVTTELGS
jgi:hypothetical protein